MMQAVLVSRPVLHFMKVPTILRGMKSSAFASQMSGKKRYEQTENHHETRNDPARRFAKAQRGSFFQDQPSMQNVYNEDPSMKSYLEQLMPDEILKEVTPHLETFGHRIVSEIDDFGRECELNPPRLQTFDAWGNRTDKLITSSAWKRQKVIAAEEGLVAIPYEQKFGPYSRVYWAAKMLLYVPSSGLYSCPLAMTDGAAKFFQLHGDEFTSLKNRTLPHLTSRNASDFWTSGQWMTERRGGSDVANGTETVAVEQADGSYKLYGYKWFSSATDADVTLTLARIVDDEGNYIKGTGGISLFYVETKKDSLLNGIEIQTLKNKLGTRQVPTAELLLDGTTAQLISDKGRGISAISCMLTITRIHNTLSAVGLMRRIVHLARDYSQKRHAFGKTIANHPLHMQTLSRMEVETRGNLALVFRICHLLGLEECNMATEQDHHLLRLLTPVAKLYSAKQAIAITSEGLESLGGQGYIEDTGFPVMFRDSQVLSIWEGTTNILSLDVLRSLVKTGGGCLAAFFTDVQSRLSAGSRSQNVNIKWCYQEISTACEVLQSFVESSGHDQNLMTVAARDFAYSLARIYIASLLLEHAIWQKERDLDVAVAKSWCAHNLCPVLANYNHGMYTAEAVQQDKAIIMDGYIGSKL